MASRARHIAVLPATTAPPALDTPDAVRRLISETVGQVRVGTLDARVGAVVIQGARVAIELAQLELAATIGNLERRLGMKRG